MLNKLLKIWLKKYDLACLSLYDVLGVLDAPLEMSDEKGVYYIEGLYFDDDGDLWGYGLDVDGGEIEVYNVTLPHDIEQKIINWLSKQLINKDSK